MADLGSGAGNPLNFIPEQMARLQRVAKWNLRWATVTQADPLRVLLDGPDTAPLNFTPDTVVSNLTTGERVLTLQVGTYTVVLGTAGGLGIEKPVPLIDTTAPNYVTRLRVSNDRVIQSFAKDQETGDYYVAQIWSNDGAGHSDNARIYHCSSTGDVISHSLLHGVGHSSSISLERDGGSVYIWTWWGEDMATGNAGGITRWKYQGGQTVEFTDTDPQPDPLGYYNCVALDQRSDRIAVADRSNGDLYLYRLSDYKAGTPQRLHTVSPGWTGFQGFTTAGEYVFVANGMGTPSQPAALHQWHWPTGDHRQVDTGHLATGPDGGNFEGHGEPEGVALWWGPSGQATILFGLAMGRVDYRRAMVFAFTPVGGDDRAYEAAKRYDMNVPPQVLSSGIITDVGAGWQVNKVRAIKDRATVHIFLSIKRTGGNLTPYSGSPNFPDTYMCRFHSDYWNAFGEDFDVLLTKSGVFSYFGRIRNNGYLDFTHGSSQVPTVNTGDFLRAQFSLPVTR